MSVNSFTYSEEDFLELKKRLQPIFEADPTKAQTDACLRRFLKAFIDVDDATTALLKYIKWRQQYGVDKLSEDDEDIKEEIETGKAIILEHPDRWGRPVMLVTARLHDATKERDLDAITKFIIYILEKAVARCNEDIIDNVSIAFDLKGFSLNNMDYNFVKQLIWLLSRRYPERLGQCLLINASLIFSGCWSLIRLWINEVTASKVVFIRDDVHMSEYMPLSILPESLFNCKVQSE